MAKIKARVTVVLEIDTEEYHIPADLNLKASLEEDIQSTLESNLSLSVLQAVVNKVQKYDTEEFNQD